MGVEMEEVNDQQADAGERERVVTLIMTIQKSKVLTTPAASVLQENHLLHPTILLATNDEKCLMKLYRLIGIKG